MAAAAAIAGPGTTSRLAASEPATVSRSSSSTAPLAGAPGHGTRRSEVVANAALVGVVLSGLVIALGAASAPSFLIYGNPSVPPVPSWLRTPLAGLGAAPGEDLFSLIVLLMFGSYLAVVRTADALRPSTALSAVVLLHAALLLAPPILSGDAFSYLAYARLYAVHGLNPYWHAAEDAPGDPLLPYVGIPEIESPYGPLFTLLTLALVPLGPALGMWALKALAVAAGIGCTALTWSCARRLGRAPLPPTLFVALNPLFLVYGVGGAHNDMVMAVVMLAGVRASLGGGARAGPLGAAGVVSAAATKATAGLVLPFAILAARRRLLALVAALATTAVLGLIALLAFGTGLLGYLDVLARQGRSVSTYSIWLDLARLGGWETVPPGMKLALGLTFAAVLLTTLVQTARGGDWIAGAGWAVLALLVLTTWLLPWYVALLLPMAALAPSGRLRTATLAFCALLLLTRLPLLLA